MKWKCCTLDTLLRRSSQGFFKGVQVLTAIFPRVPCSRSVSLEASAEERSLDTHDAMVVPKVPQAVVPCKSAFWRIQFSRIFLAHSPRNFNGFFTLIG